MYSMEFVIIRYLDKDSNQVFSERRDCPWNYNASGLAEEIKDEIKKQCTGDKKPFGAHMVNLILYKDNSIIHEITLEL